MASTQNTSSSKGKYLQYVKVLSNRPQRNMENKTVLCGYTCLEDDIFGEVESLLCNKLIIEIENSSLPVDVNNLITSKENKAAHGIGMQSIRQTVENMNGYVSCSYDNGCFSIKIILNK